MSQPVTPEAATPFLTAAWRDLLLLNYEVPAALLEPLVPRGTVLDRWQGAAIVSLVGFRFRDTAVLGWRVPGHVDFPEVNLRFYVRREEPLPGGGVEERRAVTFIRELVPRRAIAWTARVLYNEPYRAVGMREREARDHAARTLAYEWREDGAWVGFEGTSEGDPSPLTPGSEEEFITEHYWGYTRQRDGSTVEYGVAHPRWRCWTAHGVRIIGDLARTYGPVLGAVLAGPPRSSYIAEGSAVTVSRARRLPRDPTT